MLDADLKIPFVPAGIFSRFFEDADNIRIVPLLIGGGSNVIFAFGGIKPLSIRLSNPFLASISAILEGFTF